MTMIMVMMMMVIDMIICTNMRHCETSTLIVFIVRNFIYFQGLFRGVNYYLKPGGALILYGVRFFNNNKLIYEF